MFTNHARERIEQRFGPFSPYNLQRFCWQIAHKINNYDYIITDYKATDDSWEIELDVRENMRAIIKPSDFSDREFKVVTVYYYDKNYLKKKAKKKRQKFSEKKPAGRKKNPKVVKLKKEDTLDYSW